MAKHDLALLFVTVHTRVEAVAPGWVDGAIT